MVRCLCRVVCEGILREQSGRVCSALLSYDSLSSLAGRPVKKGRTFELSTNVENCRICLWCLRLSPVSKKLSVVEEVLINIRWHVYPGLHIDPVVQRWVHWCAVQRREWRVGSALEGQGCSYVVQVRLLLEVKYASFRSPAFIQRNVIPSNHLQQSCMFHETNALHLPVGCVRSTWITRNLRSSIPDTWSLVDCCDQLPQLYGRRIGALADTLSFS